MEFLTSLNLRDGEILGTKLCRTENFGMSGVSASWISVGSDKCVTPRGCLDIRTPNDLNIYAETTSANGHSTVIIKTAQSQWNLHNSGTADGTLYLTEQNSGNILFCATSAGTLCINNLCSDSISGQGAWSVSGANIYYDGGKVTIGTNDDACEMLEVRADTDACSPSIQVTGRNTQGTDLGGIKLFGCDDNTSISESARFSSCFCSNANGSESSQLIIQTKHSGSLSTRLAIGGSAVCSPNVPFCGELCAGIIKSSSCIVSSGVLCTDNSDAIIQGEACFIDGSSVVTARLSTGLTLGCNASLTNNSAYIWGSTTSSCTPNLILHDAGTGGYPIIKTCSHNCCSVADCILAEFQFISAGRADASCNTKLAGIRVCKSTVDPAIGLIAFNVTCETASCGCEMTPLRITGVTGGETELIMGVDAGGTPLKIRNAGGCCILNVCGVCCGVGRYATQFYLSCCSGVGTTSQTEILGFYCNLDVCIPNGLVVGGTLTQTGSLEFSTQNANIGFTYICPANCSCSGIYAERCNSGGSTQVTSCIELWSSTCGCCSEIRMYNYNATDGLYNSLILNNSGALCTIYAGTNSIQLKDNSALATSDNGSFAILNCNDQAIGNLVFSSINGTNNCGQFRIGLGNGAGGLNDCAIVGCSTCTNFRGCVNIDYCLCVQNTIFAPVGCFTSCIITGSCIAIASGCFTGPTVCATSGISAQTFTQSSGGSTAFCFCYTCGCTDCKIWNIMNVGCELIFRSLDDAISGASCLMSLHRCSKVQIHCNLCVTGIIRSDTRIVSGYASGGNCAIDIYPTCICLAHITATTGGKGSIVWSMCDSAGTAFEGAKINGNMLCGLGGQGCANMHFTVTRATSSTCTMMVISPDNICLSGNPVCQTSGGFCTVINPAQLTNVYCLTDTNCPTICIFNSTCVAGTTYGGYIYAQPSSSGGAMVMHSPLHLSLIAGCSFNICICSGLALCTNTNFIQSIAGGCCANLNGHYLSLGKFCGVAGASTTGICMRGCDSAGNICVMFGIDVCQECVTTGCNRPIACIYGGCVGGTKTLMQLDFHRENLNLCGNLVGQGTGSFNSNFTVGTTSTNAQSIFYGCQSGVGGKCFFILHSASNLWCLYSDGDVCFVMGGGNGFYGTSSLICFTSVCTTSNLCVGGTLGKSAGSFVIDHPCSNYEKPNKYNDMVLIHGFEEGAKYGIFYEGYACLCEGFAIVNLPKYFDKLVNRDDEIYVQITPIGNYANMYVVEEDDCIVKGNCFKVCGEKVNNKFTWRVAGARGDKYVVEDNTQTDEKGRLIIEMTKSEREKRSNEINL